MSAAPILKGRRPNVEFALAYAAKGFRIFPLSPGTKIPIKGTHGVLDATTDEATIREWWRKHPAANIGAATGSGWIVVDEDTYKGADCAAWLLPVTRSVKTASGGRHYWFRCDVPLRGVPENALGHGICIKAEGGYVVLPPSGLHGGGVYAWENVAADFASLPDHAVAMIEAYHAHPLPAAPEGGRRKVKPSKNQDRDPGGFWLDRMMAKTQPGNGDRTGYDLAVQLLVEQGNGWQGDPVDVLIAYAHFATQNPSDPFDEGDVWRWLRSAEHSRIVARGEPARSQSSRGLVAPSRPLSLVQHARPVLSVVTQGDEDGDGQPPEPPDGEGEPDGDAHLTDMGNGRRFVRLHGDTARYIAAWDRWLLWDGRRWKRDETEAASRLAKDTVRSIYGEAAAAVDDASRKSIAAWAVRSENHSRVQAMLAQARSEPEIARGTGDFDHAERTAFLLNVRNGTIDLKTGQLRPHAQEDGITKLADVEYDPAATAPRWLDFLGTIFAGDGELIAYIQRAIGYAITGDTSEQCLFILHGLGANGKSTLLDVLSRIFADYASTTPTDTLMEKRTGSIPSDVARLVGARIVTASESGDGRKLDEEFIKRATGGEVIPARFLHRDWFDFRPSFHLFLAANHKPRIGGLDMAIWRRVHLWPFNVTIPPAERDKRLAHRLYAERAGILAWAMQGIAEWQRRGSLEPPAIVLEAVDAYKSEMDPFAAFVEDSCALRVGARVTAKALIERYRNWCERNGEREQSSTRLGTYLREKLGCVPCRDHSGARAWDGIGLVYEAES